MITLVLENFPKATLLQKQKGFNKKIFISPLGLWAGKTDSPLHSEMHGISAIMTVEIPIPHKSSPVRVSKI
jgi:hypothetical protein